MGILGTSERTPGGLARPITWRFHGGSMAHLVVPHVAPLVLLGRECVRRVRPRPGGAAVVVVGAAVHCWTAGRSLARARRRVFPPNEISRAMMGGDAHSSGGGDVTSSE